MARKILKNKPLIEAIFELRWELQQRAPGVRIDPHYKIIIGRIYDRVSSIYPSHEQLPTATMPDELAGYVVQHRFRKGRDEWPLIQIGPGIITLNDTAGYTWDDFARRISDLLDILFESYPDAKSNLKINSLLLRYIDAIDFDYEKCDVLNFLKEKLKINVEIHEKLFENTWASGLPLNLDLRASFPSTKPKGAVHLRIARGKSKGTDALV